MVSPFLLKCIWNQLIGKRQSLFGLHIGVWGVKLVVAGKGEWPRQNVPLFKSKDIVSPCLAGHIGNTGSKFSKIMGSTSNNFIVLRISYSHTPLYFLLLIIISCFYLTLYCWYDVTKSVRSYILNNFLMVNKTGSRVVKRGQAYASSIR